MTTIRYEMSEQEAINGLLSVRKLNHPWANFRGAFAAGLGGSLIIFRQIYIRVHVPKSLPFVGIALVIGVMALIFFLNRFSTFRAISRQVRNNPARFTSPEELSFDRQVLVISSPTQKQEFTWTTFNKRVQDEHYIYLLAGPGGFYVILPKRAFSSADLDEFLRCSQSLSTT